MNTIRPILKRKGIQITAIAVLSLLLVAAAVFTYYKLFMDPYRETISQPKATLELNQTLSQKQARKDLAYVKEQLEKYHPAYLDGSDEKINEVAKQYQLEVSSLKDNITVLELWQSAGRIAAKLEDGHTNISVYHDAQDYYISDLRQLKDYGKPIAINGVPVKEVYETFRSQFSCEREAYAEYIFYHMVITSKNYLSFSGVDTSEGVVFTFQSDQESIDYPYHFVPRDQVIGLEEEEELPPVSYSMDQQHNLAVFCLKECDYNEEYLSKLQAFFDDVSKNHIENIVVDLRDNPGGNSLAANSFLEYINVDSYQSWDCAIRLGWYLKKYTNNVIENPKKEPLFTGKIFVLTNTRTYSSAMDFAMLIKDNQMGVLVGETSGNLPDSYGDTLGFQLPNSKLYLNVSYKKWYRVDKRKAGEPLEPDYVTESDNALEKVYELMQ